MKVIELFSGIGGMHYALNECGTDAEVMAVEINTVANSVYQYNFSSKVLQKNILCLNAEDINKFGPEMLLMSPPCQPFTRVGLKKDLNDVRSDPLKHIISLLPNLLTLTYVLVENVKGFECSEARIKLISSLKNLEFDVREFLLSPSQVGVPNMRTRYYLLAKKQPLQFSFKTDKIMDTLPKEAQQILDLLSNQFPTTYSVHDVLETDDTISNLYQEHLIPGKVLERRAWVMDIVTKHATKTCCFTKAYGQYAEGTGSVYCPLDQEVINRTFQGCTRESVDQSEIRALQLRYFTPREVSRLMSFPDDRFLFPPITTKRQKYRLLGNSVNVKVVALLIRMLLSQPQS